MMSDTPDMAVGAKSHSHLRTLFKAPDPFECSPATLREACHAPELGHSVCYVEIPAQPIQLHLV